MILAIVVPVIGITSLTNASFDCSTVNRDTMRAIFEKQAAGTTLTSDERTLLENAKTCQPPKREDGKPEMRNGTWTTQSQMTPEQRAQMDIVKALVDKKRGGTTLTADEEAFLAKFEAKRPQGDDRRWGSGSMMPPPKREDGKPEMRNGTWTTQSQMTPEQRAQMDIVKALVDKKRGGTTLTADEEAFLAKFEAKRPQGDDRRWGSGSMMPPPRKDDGMRDGSWSTFPPKREDGKPWQQVNPAYKTIIDQKLKAVIDSLASLSTSDKVLKLTALKDKIVAAKASLQSSTTLDNTKKALYVSILGYMANQIQAQIDTLNGANSTDDINNLLNGILQ